MNRIVSVEQMSTIDARAICGDRAVGYGYMKRAGAALFRAACGMAGDPGCFTGEIAVLCGKGNNGGDGFVAARLLLEGGYRVCCFSVATPKNLTGEALLAYNDLLACNGEVLPVEAACAMADFDERFPLVVDALLGTGSHGDPRGLFADIINKVNSGSARVLAADTPSGLDNDTGIPGNPCFEADMTITFGFSKVGQYFHPGKKCLGTLVVEELGYPENIVASVVTLPLGTPSPADLRKMLPSRKPAGSKIDHGLALVFGGSPGMAGSITLCANAAMRTGCGMVHCAFPESLTTILSVKLTEPVLHPLLQPAQGTAHGASLDTLLVLSKRMQAVCAGPGLSCDPGTTALVRDFVAQCNTPLILDADGINAFRDAPDEIGCHAGELLITPHYREWERLFGALPEKPLERIDCLRGVAARYSLTILLKGNPTIVAEPHGTVFILPYGNSALAKAGSGDVLSGSITSLVAQGACLTDAAVLGAYIHGAAGVLASEQLSEYSVTASDVIAFIAPVIVTLL